MLKRRRFDARLLGPAAMQLRERAESLRLATDDREGHRKTEHPGTHRGLGRAADGDPDRDGLVGSRIHTVPVGRLPGLADAEKLQQLLLEQRVVVAKVEAEERERLDERAAADHHLARPPDRRSRVANC